jgi:NAD dependent epimerase/dehydratase
MAERVLVTGAAGFIGSHLVERLVRQGFAVRAFVHYNALSSWGHLEKLSPDILAQVEVMSGDLADSFMVDHAVSGCDLVFHLGALIGIPYSYTAPAAYVATNVSGTLNVLQACRRHDVRRVMHTSTSEVYGTAQYVPIDEKHPLVGQSPYSASKIGADKLAESYWLSFKTPVVTVRPFNTYGPRQSARAVIPTIITQALVGDQVKLGATDTVRDFTFVEDTAAGFIAAARAAAVDGEVLNLGTGEAVTVGNLVERVSRILGKPLAVRQDPVRLRPVASEVGRLISNNDKARRLLDWKPETDLETGLARTVDAIAASLAEYKTNLYGA